jgi:type II secretion system protein H
MIKAAKTKPSRGGFTLIEIVMVLAIAAIISAGAIGLMVSSSDERTLRRVSGEIELMAKQARTTAILHQTPYAVEFSEEGIRLLPLAQAIEAASKKSSKSRRKELKSGEADTSGSRQLALENGMAVSIRRWKSEVLLNTNKKAVHLWRFDPDGLCEPISVHLVYGKSWYEDTYHPLTATISDTQSYAP